MCVKERVKMFTEYKKMTISKFEEVCDLSNGYIAAMRKGFGQEKLNNVLTAFPELNREWLLYGEGEMLKDVLDENITEEVNTTIIPVLPIYAMGGALTGFDPSVTITDCEKMVSPIKGAELAIGVYGESMTPEYPNGSRILIKRIDMGAFIEWGKAYVLATTNGSILKVIYPKGEDGVECRSINPDYPPFVVKYKDIHAMYRVMMCMALK